MIDNIFTNAITKTVLSGNLVDKLSDHMSNLAIFNELKIKKTDNISETFGGSVSQLTSVIDIYQTLDLGSGPLSKHPLPPARHLPHLTRASIRPTFPGINPDQEMKQCINKSYRAALITSENPELTEVDLEPSSKRGCSDRQKVYKIILRARQSSQLPGICN